jgi:hypothetical protein
VFFDEDMLKMTYGSGLLLADDADDKNDDKSQITRFFVFI